MRWMKGKLEGWMDGWVAGKLFYTLLFLLKMLIQDLAFDDLFLVPVESDLIDQVWGHHNKPPQQNNKLFIMDFSYSGKK